MAVQTLGTTGTGGQTHLILARLDTNSVSFETQANTIQFQLATCRASSFSLRPVGHQLTPAPYVLPGSTPLPPKGAPAMEPDCYALIHEHCPWHGSNRRGNGGRVDRFRLPPRSVISTRPISASRRI